LRAQYGTVILEVRKHCGNPAILLVVALQARTDKQDVPLLVQGK
jgi:hypothetical protein